MPAKIRKSKFGSIRILNQGRNRLFVFPTFLHPNTKALLSHNLKNQEYVGKGMRSTKRATIELAKNKRMAVRIKPLYPGDKTFSEAGTLLHLIKNGVSAEVPLAVFVDRSTGKRLLITGEVAGEDLEEKKWQGRLPRQKIKQLIEELEAAGVDTGHGIFFENIIEQPTKGGLLTMVDAEHLRLKRKK